MSPPCAPMPGTRKPRPGADRPDRRQLRRGGRADDEADRPAGPPAGHVPGDPDVERLRRGVDGRIGRHDQVLELGRLGVGRPAQDVGVPVDALEERLDGLGRRGTG